MIHHDVTTLKPENTSLDNNRSYCEAQQPENPYCGVFGAGEIIEVTFIAIFMVVGTFGNLLVIFSIILDKRVNRNGNLFYINLAVADLIVSGFFLPTVLLNVIYTHNVLPMPACQFAGYVVTVTCACSVCNMAFIAISRYWYIARSKTYKRVFCKRNVVFMVLFTWFWPNLIVSPTLFGWSSLIYDNKMAECGWDDQASLCYNIGLMICSIFIPVTIILFCYWRLYIYVRNSGKWFRAKGSTYVNDISNAQHQARLRREMTLLKTLGVTVAFFILCWIPYGVVVLFFAKTVPAQAKKAAARFGLFNSSINFIIYGVINPVFRMGYQNLVSRVLCSDNVSRRTLQRPANRRERTLHHNYTNKRAPPNRIDYITSKKVCRPSPPLQMHGIGKNDAVVEHKAESFIEDAGI